MINMVEYEETKRSSECKLCTFSTNGAGVLKKIPPKNGNLKETSKSYFIPHMYV